jgi:arsenite-transporting ATPase
MNDNRQIYFFLGKGGVGKSTLSALNALKLSKDADTLLISMDPAHNQSDIFENNFTEKALSVQNNLAVIEVDIDLWIKRYLKDIQSKISDSYRYLSAINLDKKFEVLKFSPGLEEYALLLAFETILKKYNSYQYLIFDMPPTALALRFFTLPTLSLLWIENLLELRREIIDKREIITKIKIGKKSFEQDKVLNKLDELKLQYKQLNEQFTDSARIKVNIVMNSDRLSLKESERISKHLDRLGIHISDIFLNKVNDTAEDFNSLPSVFKDSSKHIYPRAGYQLIGLTALNKFLSQID